MSTSPPDTSPAGVVAAEAVLQNPATLSDLLGVRSYVRFWIGAVCNRLSVQVQAIALAWQVYAVARHSASVSEAALAVGMLGLAQFLPMFALTLFAGHAADIYDRRKIMMAGLGAAALHVGPVRRDGLWRAQPSLADLRRRGFVRLRPGLLYAGERGARADAGRATADPARDRGQFGGQSDGDHRRSRHRRAPGGVFARRGFRRVGRALPGLARLAQVGGVAAAPAASDRLALGADRRRLELCVDDQGRPRRHQPRPVRGSLGRRHGPLAGLCPRHPACRAGRLRNPPRRAVGRRDRPRLRIGRAAAEVACGLKNVRSGRDLRALHLGVRFVTLDGLERRLRSRCSGRPTWSRSSCVRAWCRS